MCVGGNVCLSAGKQNFINWFYNCIYNNTEKGDLFTFNCIFQVLGRLPTCSHTLLYYCDELPGGESDSGGVWWSTKGLFLHHSSQARQQWILQREFNFFFFFQQGEPLYSFMECLSWSSLTCSHRMIMIDCRSKRVRHNSLPKWTASVGHY